MAASQLDVQTPQGSNGMTVCLSEKTRVIAHAGLKYKSGYITISRLSQDQGKWRNVHIARKSFEKLMAESESLLEALNNKELYQVQLTKKQFMMTTKFKKSNLETLHFISILHPKTEQDNLNIGTEFNHAKTINLNKEEYEKFHQSLDKLYQVIIKTVQPSENNDGDQGPHDEPATVTGYRWQLVTKGTRSNSIFLTRKECDENARSYIANLPDEVKQSQHASEYEVNPVIVPFPSKIEVIEHMIYRHILKKTGIAPLDLAFEPPSVEVIDEAIPKISKTDVVLITANVAAMLGHKRLYFLADIYDIFVYMGGYATVRETILKHNVSPSGKLFARLLDSCYENVVNRAEREE